MHQELQCVKRWPMSNADDTDKNPDLVCAVKDVIGDAPQCLSWPIELIESCDCVAVGLLGGELCFLETV